VQESPSEKNFTDEKHGFADVIFSNKPTIVLGLRNGDARPRGDGATEVIEAQ
jgi:hypothetical protein